MFDAMRNLISHFLVFLFFFLTCNIAFNSIQGVHGQGKSQGKNIFSRSGNCQGILKFVRDFWNLSKSQGKVREF